MSCRDIPGSLPPVHPSPFVSVIVPDGTLYTVNRESLKRAFHRGLTVFQSESSRAFDFQIICFSHPMAYAALKHILEEENESWGVPESRTPPLINRPHFLYRGVMVIRDDRAEARAFTFL